jgi:hypothetical protein
VALGEQPEGQPRDPRLERVREGFLKAFPEIAEMIELAKRRQDIEGLLERGQDLDAVTQAEWRRLADATRTNLFTSYASQMLGAGKTDADLSEQQKKELVADFASFLRSDPKLAQRYESGDSTLVGEYLNRARSLWAPVQREAVAGTFARMPAAPSEGPSGGAPAGNRPGAPSGPQSNDDRMDSAIDRAFEYISTARQ